MKANFPEVLNNTRVEPMGSIILIDKDKKIEVKESIAADNEFLSVFSYPLLAGNPKTALNEPFNIILSETLAKKLYSVSDNNYSSLLGKTLKITRDSLPYKITGICKDVQRPIYSSNCWLPMSRFICSHIPGNKRNTIT
jgi:putative ABC transport system permease protein